MAYYSNDTKERKRRVYRYLIAMGYKVSVKEIIDAYSLDPLDMSSARITNCLEELIDEGIVKKEKYRGWYYYYSAYQEHLEKHKSLEEQVSSLKYEHVNLINSFRQSEKRFLDLLGKLEQTHNENDRVLFDIYDEYDAKIQLAEIEKQYLCEKANRVLKYKKELEMKLAEESFFSLKKKEIRGNIKNAASTYNTISLQRNNKEVELDNLIKEKNSRTRRAEDEILQAECALKDFEKEIEFTETEIIEKRTLLINLETELRRIGNLFEKWKIEGYIN